MNRGNQ